MKKMYTVLSFCNFFPSNIHGNHMIFRSQTSCEMDIMGPLFVFLPPIHKNMFWLYSRKTEENTGEDFKWCSTQTDLQTFTLCRLELALSSFRNAGNIALCCFIVDSSFVSLWICPMCLSFIKLQYWIASVHL